jgi:hypothetical protein
VRGNFAIGLFFDSGTLDKLKFCYQPLANIFNLAGIDFSRSANGPRRKPFSGNAGAS